MGITTTGKKLIKYLFHLLQKYAGVLGILVLWLLFAKPYFFDNLVPFPTRQLVTFFSPWNVYEEYAGPVKNNAMPDVITQIYPWKYFAITELKQGRLPLWNPYNFSGYPQLANFQTAIFSPFTILYFLFPFIDAWSIVVLIQPLLGGLFMYLFLRELELSKPASLTGSVSFMFCGFIVVWMAYGTLAMAIVFLPLALYAVERYWKRKKNIFLFILALSIAFSILSGHFQTSLYLLFAVSLFILYKFLKTRQIRLSLVVSGTVGVGIFLSLIQLIPTAVLYSYSARSGSEIVDTGIPFYYLITSFAPDFFGNPVTRNDWIGFYAERASFIGIIPLTLSFFALFRKKQVIFFLILGLVSLLLALNTPLQLVLGNVGIPVLSSSNPTRIIVLWSFAFSTLAAFGFDVLISFLEKRKTRHVIGVLLITAVLIGGIWLSLAVFHVLSDEKQAIASRNFLLPTVIFLSFFSVCVSSLIIRDKKRSVAIAIIIALVGFDSYRFATKWMPFDRRDLLFPKKPVISAMQQLQGEGRVFGSFGTEVQTYYGIRSLEGYDPLYLRRYGEFIKAATTGTYTPPDRSFVTLDRHAQSIERVLDFLSVSLIYHPKSHTFEKWAYPVWSRPDRYTLIYEDEKFQLYRNTTMLPRARLYYSYEYEDDPKELLKRFYEKDFPFQTTLLFEEKPRLKEMKQHTATGTATILSLHPTQIRIRAKTLTPGFLFLSDPYYPNWKATVNGKEAHIYRANYAFRAVEVPKGESEIIFRYTYF